MSELEETEASLKSNKRERDGGMDIGGRGPKKKTSGVTRKKVAIPIPDIHILAVTGSLKRKEKKLPPQSTEHFRRTTGELSQ